MTDRQPQQVCIAHLLVSDDLVSERIGCFQVTNIRGPIFMVGMCQALS